MGAVMEPRRPPGGYLHGFDGPVVVVPARVAALLMRRCGLEDYHREHRGEDAELDTVLVDLKTAGMAWRVAHQVATDSGSVLAEVAQQRSGSPRQLSTAQAARSLGITDRAVRLAIAAGRLPAEWVGGRYVLAPEDVEHFRARRAA